MCMEFACRRADDFLFVLFSHDLIDRLSQSFTLMVTHSDTGKSYRLNFPGTKTIQEVES